MTWPSAATLTTDERIQRLRKALDWHPDGVVYDEVIVDRGDLAAALKALNSAEALMAAWATLVSHER